MRRTWGNVLDKEVGEDKPSQLLIKPSNMEKNIALVIWNTQIFVSPKDKNPKSGKIQNVLNFGQLL